MMTTSCLLSTMDVSIFSLVASKGKVNISTNYGRTEGGKFRGSSCNPQNDRLNFNSNATKIAAGIFVEMHIGRAQCVTFIFKMI